MCNEINLIFKQKFCKKPRSVSDNSVDILTVPNFLTSLVPQEQQLVPYSVSLAHHSTIEWKFCKASLPCLICLAWPEWNNSYIPKADLSSCIKGIISGKYIIKIVFLLVTFIDGNTITRTTLNSC